MEFKDFVQILHPIIGGSSTQGAFVKTLFDVIATEEGQSALEEQSTVTYRSYFNGSTGISRIAQKINPYIETENFVKYIEQFSDETISSLCDSFRQYLPEIDAFNAGIQLAELFRSIAEMMMAIQSFSKEYYQLIVTCEDDVFANNVVTIPASRALTKHNVPAEIFERCSTLTKDGIEELKRFPAIICRENTEFKGVTDPNQWAMFAYIKVVRVSGQNIKIAFNPIVPIQQQKLCDKRNAVFFDLNMDCAITDLNHSAWSVHKANIFEAFDEAGIPGIPRPI